MAKSVKAVALDNMTKAELIAVIRTLVAQEPTQAPVAKKVAPKATKKVAVKAVTTRTQAVADWKQARNINADTQAAYKAEYANRFASDWAEWVALANAKGLKGAERKVANQATAKFLRNTYRAAVGMNELSFEK